MELCAQTVEHHTLEIVIYCVASRKLCATMVFGRSPFRSGKPLIIVAWASDFSIAFYAELKTIFRYIRSPSGFFSSSLPNQRINAFHTIFKMYRGHALCFQIVFVIWETGCAAWSHVSLFTSPSALEMGNISWYSLDDPQRMRPLPARPTNSYEFFFNCYTYIVHCTVENTLCRS